MTSTLEGEILLGKKSQVLHWRGNSTGRQTNSNYDVSRIRASKYTKAKTVMSKRKRKWDKTGGNDGCEWQQVVTPTLFCQ